MQEAEITSLFRTLAIIFIIYYGLKLFSRYVAPILLKRAASKFEERVKNQQQPSEPRGNVGDTIIDKKPKIPRVGCFREFTVTHYWVPLKMNL